MRGLETQQDMNFTTDHPSGNDAVDQAAQQYDQAEDIDDDIDPGARSQVFPDVEDVDQAIDETTQTSYQKPVHDSPKRKGGFRRGFFFVVILVLLLTSIYIFAPELAEQIPATEPYLAQYTDLVDQGRVVMDDYIMKALTWLDSLTSEYLKPSE